MVLAERKAIIALLRERIATHRSEYDALAPKTHRRSSELGAIQTLEAAIRAIEAGESERFFGAADPPG